MGNIFLWLPMRLDKGQLLWRKQALMGAAGTIHGRRTLVPFMAVATVGPRSPWFHKFLVYLVILCFDRRCPKQNTVARLKSQTPPTILVWLRHW